MNLLLPISLLFLFHLININADPSNPGYYPSLHFRTKSFQHLLMNLWGPEHQKLDNGVLNLTLDKDYGGSGFKSKSIYHSGYFGADIKLSEFQYTAGVDVSFYLSSNDNCSRKHDEIDMEFLGHTKGNPYVLQTNIYIQDYSGETNTIGREMKFHLWFDPASDYHNYAIYYDPDQIIFFVDDIPIRKYPEDTDKGVAPRPKNPMWVYGSIWDASAWATDYGQSKIDFGNGPFKTQYKNFRMRNCNVKIQKCPVFSKGQFVLSEDQKRAMESVQQDRNIMIYNYCDQDDNMRPPECRQG